MYYGQVVIGYSIDHDLIMIARVKLKVKLRIDGNVIINRGFTLGLL